MLVHVNTPEGHDNVNEDKKQKLTVNPATSSVGLTSDSDDMAFHLPCSDPYVSPNNSAIVKSGVCPGGTGGT